MDRWQERKNIQGWEVDILQECNTSLSELVMGLCWKDLETLGEEEDMVRKGPIVKDFQG